jgi:hypothetical protein
MSLFRPDNPKRQERARNLKTQATTYYVQSKAVMKDCETQAAKLFESTEAIAKLQNKNIADFFPNGAIYHNAVFEGGFEYYSPTSGAVNKMPKVLYYTLTAALTAGTVTAYYRAGMVLAVMEVGQAGAAQMRFWRILRLGQVAGREAGFGAAGRYAARLSRIGTILMGVDIAFQFVNFGLDLASDEEAYKELVQAIHDLAPMRLNACAQLLMSEQLEAVLLQHATEADIDAKNPDIVAKYDIKGKLNAISAEITKIWDEVSADALMQVKKEDDSQGAYRTDDLTLTADSTDLAPRTSPTMKKFELGSGAVVNWIRSFNDKEDGVKFGNDGGDLTTITLDANEQIQSATWKTGLAEDGQNKVIFALTIKTNSKTYGPFGSGDKVQTDAAQQSFNVPDRMRVIGITDLSADVVNEGDDAVIKSKPFVAELRFIITADK